MLMFYEKGAWASRFVIFLLIPSWACMLAWHKFLSNQFFRIFSSFLFPWAHWPPFFFLLWSWARWPIGFFTLPLHFLCLWACWLLFLAMLLLPLLLDFHSSFTLLLPLTVPMGLLAITSYDVGPLAFYLFCWAPISLILLSCFFHSFPSSSSFTIGIFFLLLGFLSKTDINIQLLEHVNCLYNSYMNTFAVFFFTGFLNSGPHISFSSMNKLSFQIS